jgi:para-aminobenzoate synthetase/4-amino-4-deoxychorismate lyase
LFVYTAFEKQPLLFAVPEKVISCNSLALLASTFDLMEKALDKGYYLAGFLSYEAGHGLEKKLSGEQVKSNFPLLKFGCYSKPVNGAGLFAGDASNFQISEIKTSIPYEAYSRDIAAIHSRIAAGDVYQITYCLKLKFNFQGSAIALFTRLAKEHPVPYPAYIQTENLEILSLSPEMLLKKTGSRITTKPMKGTWPRGTHPLSDIAARLRLKYDQKNRAENVMICDLLRNDLGRLGTDITVDKIFEVTGYRTLYQMTSTVRADIDKNKSVYELFSSLFPSGSVTGAPKIEAMKLIGSLEREERKIYTGAIGYITPQRDMFFNVPIRTILLEDGRGEMGVGGGIIWDSTALGEWEEGLLKSKFLTSLKQC